MSISLCCVGSTPPLFHGVDEDDDDGDDDDEDAVDVLFCPSESNKQNNV